MIYSTQVLIVEKSLWMNTSNVYIVPMAKVFTNVVSLKSWYSLLWSTMLRMRNITKIKALRTVGLDTATRKRARSTSLFI